MKTDAATSQEFDRFDRLVGKALSVPKIEVQRHIEEDKRTPKVKDGKRTA